MVVCPPDALRRYAGCAAGDHLVASVFYKDYASLFRNNKSIVKMVTPANYVSAVVKYSKMRWFAGDQTLVRIGEDAHKGALIASQRKKTVLVVVVGEASRAANYSLNGYPRETNPELKKQDVINFPRASSCGTETAVSVPCMFSGMTRKNMTRTSPIIRKVCLMCLTTPGSTCCGATTTADVKAPATACRTRT